jgi:deoxyribonuclease V
MIFLCGSWSIKALLPKEEAVATRPKAPLHTWKLTAQEAVALQRKLAPRLQLAPPPPAIRWVAGADLSFNRFDDRLYAALCIMDLETGNIVETALKEGRVTFPYVPGLLSFREIPVLLQCFDTLHRTPDVVICDGQGLAHPRRIGLACHLGLWLQLPTIGCAKSLLCGTHGHLGDERGAIAALIDREEQVGVALRTRNGVKPVYVSPGHLCDMDTAIAVVLRATPTYRLPAPIRAAHNAANTLRRAQMS